MLYDAVAVTSLLRLTTDEYNYYIQSSYLAAYKQFEATQLLRRYFDLFAVFYDISKPFLDVHNDFSVKISEIFPSSLEDDSGYGKNV